MIKLFVGGSPCTYWSIARRGGRETEPSGIGWELFQNYVIGLRKYKPDYFLYENNKSMAKAIRDKITEELGVEPILIDSALLSAQHRERLHWTNIPDVQQPEDRSIVLMDVLLWENIPDNLWYDSSVEWEWTGDEQGVVMMLKKPWLDSMRRVYSCHTDKSPTLTTCNGGHKKNTNDFKLFQMIMFFL